MYNYAHFDRLFALIGRRLACCLDIGGGGAVEKPIGEEQWEDFLDVILGKQFEINHNEHQPLCVSL